MRGQTIKGYSMFNEEVNHLDVNTRSMTVQDKQDRLRKVRSFGDEQLSHREVKQVNIHVSVWWNSAQGSLGRFSHMVKRDKPF